MTPCQGVKQKLLKTKIMQKISTLVGIIIIIVATAVLFGGVFTYQYLTAQKVNNQLKVKNQQKNQNNLTQNQEINIPPFSIKVLSPNGGEIFTKGEDIVVRWVSKNVEKVYIRALYYDTNGKVGIPDGKNYSFNEGQCRITYEPVFAQLGNFTIKEGNTGRCGVLEAGNIIKIEVTEYGASKNPVRDVSDSYFSITGVPSQPLITATLPNGDETWKIGETHDITWKYSNIKYVAISLQKGFGNYTSTLLAADIPASNGKFSWLIPFDVAAGNDYKIRIQGSNSVNWYQRSVIDESDSYFGIIK